MTVIEKAYKIRNLWNRWNDTGKNESVLAEKIDKVDEDMKKATYSKNGYSYFKTFGCQLSLEEVERQKSYLIEKHERAVNNLIRIEKELEKLLTP